MNTLTLFDALKIIGEGRAEEILDQLQEMRLRYPLDMAANYVLAHAMDVCELHSRAEGVWDTAYSLQETGTTAPKMEPMDDVPTFKHTDSLRLGLSRILAEDETDEIQQLILRLKVTERKTLDDMDEDSFDNFPEDTYDEDPITETFARILITQKKYAEAAAVYRSLSEQDQGEKERLLHEAERLDHLSKLETDT